MMAIASTLLEYASILLIGIGSLFILVDLRASFDRIFRYFGVSLILISSMAALDLYTGSPDVPLQAKLTGQQLLHGLACIFFPFSGVYLMLIAGMRIPWAKWLLIGAGIAFAPLIPTDLMLVVADGAVKGGPLYLPLFFPYALFYINFSYYVLVRNLARTSAGQRKFAAIHLAAFVVLTLSGLMDMIGIVDPSWKAFVSYKIFGIILFGAMSAYVFTERFFILLRERQETYDRLEALRKRMDESDPLRAIGQSAAHISHEIKNYLAAMRSNTSLIRLKSEDPGTLAEAERIDRSAQRLEGFTRSILNYASATGSLAAAECCAREAAADCMRDFFPGRGGDIRIEPAGAVLPVRAEKVKLGQVYLNLLNNAFEAGARTVTLSLEGGDGIGKIRIEDDGPGCGEEGWESLGRPFYTTKKASGGNGLGIAISRSIIEGYGGRLRFGPRDPDSGSGLVAVIELPGVVRTVQDVSSPGA